MRAVVRSRGLGDVYEIQLRATEESSIRRVKQEIEPRDWELIETTFRTGEA